MLPLELAARYVISRKRPMFMSLLGIVFGICFFVLTQAQTAGFEAFFIRTILGTNGSLLISDRLQNSGQLIERVTADGSREVVLNPEASIPYQDGIDQPEVVRAALSDFPEVIGISEVLKGHGVIKSIRNKSSVEIHGIRLKDHNQVSDLRKYTLIGTTDLFESDPMGVFLGSRIFQQLGVKVGDRVSLKGSYESIQLRVSGVFETGVSEIDKNRIYLHLNTARMVLGRPFGGSVFQVALQRPEIAPQVAGQLQSVLGHRVVSWQEREQVWLDVFKALRFSSAITVSTILLLSGLGIFNVFAIMVIEKKRDIAILRSIGFSQSEVASVFLWQGLIILVIGIVLGSLFGFLATYGVSVLPLRIRGIFSSDTFIVNWDMWHYVWAALISTFFVALATWVPARRASRIEPAKIIRETH